MGKTAGKVVIVIIILVVYVATSVGTSLAIMPLEDEAFSASPAINLIREGHMGCTVLECRGFYNTRMDERTYWQPPLQYLALSVWFRIFGISLLSLRMFSTILGIVGLFCLFVIVRKLTGNPVAGILAVALLSVDFNFIFSAASGRMDMMCAVLSLAGFAFYLTLRERNFTLAIFLGHTFTAASGLTHPHAIVTLVGMVVLNAYLDLSRIRVKHVLLALVPYVIGFGAWGLYILQDPQAFYDQFISHIDRKMWGYTSILGSLKTEIVNRYLFDYGIHSKSTLIGKSKALILLAYLIGIIGAVLMSRKSGAREKKSLLVLLLAYFLGQTFLIIGNKSLVYFVHIMPFCAAILAIWASTLWGKSKSAKYFIVGLLSIFILIQVGVNVNKILKDPYHSQYLPVAEAVRQYDDGSKLIMGVSRFAFTLGFNENFIDDPSLGFYRGREPDIVIMSSWYRDVFKFCGEWDPALELHINRVFENSDMVFDNGLYQVYVVRKPANGT
ncbi:MAG: glycosyltransferase family 39 protein [bacterium]|nr:glycosyltransferase family 39 protein [bacterium]